MLMTQNIKINSTSHAAAASDARMKRRCFKGDELENKLFRGFCHGNCLVAKAQHDNHC